MNNFFFLNGEMTTVIRDKIFASKSVLSGVPQGSVLALIMFAVYVDDMPERIDSYINLFADDTKLLRRVQKN